MTQAADFDVFIVGGGINGAGIAADAAGRGLRVGLAEMADLASATSSASSKLIHGGLRYLEQYEFRLVREALAEREVLLRKAPHLIWPLRFVVPHVPGVRPRWMVRAGLALYDHLARREVIPGSGAVDLTRDPAGRPLKAEYGRGFTYWDCWADDARLVVLNAMAARQLGASVLTRTKVTGCIADAGLWRITLRDAAGALREVRARALVNAAGPWVEQIESLAHGNQPRVKAHVRLVKGSHLVVRRIAGAESAYLMQSADKRVVFALPFEEQFTIIGTTDVIYAGDPSDVAASPEEEQYLLELAGRFFKAPLSSADVVWRYAGVRPLYDDASDNPSAVTRDYHLEVSAGVGQPPRLAVFGGKITTYRRLAEEVIARLTPHLHLTMSGRPIGPAWTAKAPLPGGDLPARDFDAFVAGLAARLPAFDAGFLRRLARRHGAGIADVLGDARTSADMGTDFANGLTAREVDYMRVHEWATTPDDVLWRRSKVGLHVSAERSANDAKAVTDAVANVL